MNDLEYNYTITSSAHMTCSGFAQKTDSAIDSIDAERMANEMCADSADRGVYVSISHQGRHIGYLNRDGVSDRAKNWNENE